MAKLKSKGKTLHKNGTFYVASELKALEPICTKIELFPPGHYFYSKDNAYVQWYKRDWTDYDAVEKNQTSIEAIRLALEAAVRRQLMSDVPYGVLLSGGLDSSVTSAIAKKYAQKRMKTLFSAKLSLLGKEKSLD